MNQTIEAVILGVVQGLTEFLPVSSSGHLEIAKFIMQQDLIAGESMLMSVVLHFATALSTVAIFRKDIAEILRGLFQFKVNDEFWFSCKIVLSMLPAVAVGLVFEDQIEQLFDKQLLLVGLMLIVTAVLLLLADRAKNSSKPVGIVDALIIGIAQAIAILPGISRSGATISTSVLLGVDRDKAARFSFLMVVPLILGKMAKDVLGAEMAISSERLWPLVIGFLAAFATGLFACALMIKLVKACKLSYFSYYCLIVAMIAIAKAANVF